MSLSSTPDSVLAKVEARIAEIRTRYKNVQPMMAGLPVNPLDSTEFKKFLEDHLNEVLMAYVVLNRYALDPEEGAPPDAGDDPLSKKLAAHGFSISAAARAAGTNVDPALAANPAAAAAMRGGLDLTRDQFDDDDSRPRK